MSYPTNDGFAPQGFNTIASDGTTDVITLDSETIDDVEQMMEPDFRYGTILPPSDTFDVINKVAKKGLFPDSTIRKSQGTAGASTLHFAVEQQDADGAWHLASRPGKLLSPSYLLVTNDEIKEMVHEVARRTGYDFQPVRETFDGTRYEYYLASPSFVNRVGELREVERGNHTFVDPNDPNGDYIRLGLRGINTYDGSAKARVEAFVERLVCLNGALVKDELFSFTFEHKISSNGGQAQWEQELEKAGFELRNLHTRFDEFASKLTAMREQPVGMDQLSAFSRALPTSFPSTVYGTLIRRFLDHEEPTVFGLYNAATFVTWHGSVTQADLGRNEDLVALLLDSGTISLN